MASRALKIEPIKAVDTTPYELVEIVVAEKASKDAVAALAYQLWQERGCPVGSDQEDWFRAEQQLRG